MDAICAVDGVDGGFIDPADLSASMGYIGQLQHPEALKVADDAIARIQKSGKAEGILTADEKLAKHYIDIGALFVAVGLDNNILMRGTKALVERFKDAAPVAASASASRHPTPAYNAHLNRRRSDSLRFENPPPHESPCHAAKQECD